MQDLPEQQLGNSQPGKNYIEGTVWHARPASRRSRSAKINLAISPAGATLSFAAPGWGDTVLISTAIVLLADQVEFLDTIQFGEVSHENSAAFVSFAACQALGASIFVPNALKKDDGWDRSRR